VVVTVCDLRLGGTRYFFRGVNACKSCYIKIYGLGGTDDLMPMRS
jgi:hypothetical protein